MDDARTNAILHNLYWRAGGRKHAGTEAMLRRIVDDGSNLLRQQAFPADFEGIVLTLLARHGMAREEEFRLDMLELACEAGYARLAAHLLANGLVLTAENGALCMAIAICHGHAPLLEILIDAGASVHASDSAAIPMLSHAIAAGNRAVIERLFAAGARPDRQGHALATAAIHGDAQMLGLCLAQGASQQALDEAFALALAAEQPETMAALLEAGADAGPALEHARQRGDEQAPSLVRAALFAQGRYDQLLPQPALTAAPALQAPAALNKTP